MVLKSYAKINLSLIINKKLHNGFHNLQSYYSLINFYDEIYIKKTNKFKEIIETGIRQRYLKEFGNSNPKRYRGNKTMRDFLLNLSKELHIQQKVKVTEVKPTNNKICITKDKIKELVSYDGVISTLPAPQNYELLNEFPSLQKTLKTGSYHACIALMFTFDEIPCDLKTHYDF